jgi:hypothetical protein
VARSNQLRQYPFVAWERLKPAIKWTQGQHVFCCGGTGSGKSTVAGEFLPRRSQVVVCVSKGMDPIFDTPYYREYERITKWPPPRGVPGKPGPDRVLLWPKNQKTLRETAKHKQAVFQHMFDDILLVRGNWCVDIDETHYMSHTLGLRQEITDMLEQGRSAGISMWNNTQRPADIPLAIYVNSSHAFLFQAQEDYDVQRLANLKNKHTTGQEMRYNLDLLDSFRTHEFVYLDRTGVIPPVRSIVQIRRGNTRGTDKR